MQTISWAAVAAKAPAEAPAQSAVNSNARSSETEKLGTTDTSFVGENAALPSTGTAATTPVKGRKKKNKKSVHATKPSEVDANTVARPIDAAGAPAGEIAPNAATTPKKCTADATNNNVNKVPAEATVEKQASRPLNISASSPGDVSNSPVKKKKKKPSNWNKRLKQKEAKEQKRTLLMQADAVDSIGYEAAASVDTISTVVAAPGEQALSRPSDEVVDDCAEPTTKQLTSLEEHVASEEPTGKADDVPAVATSVVSTSSKEQVTRPGSHDEAEGNSLSLASSNGSPCSSDTTLNPGKVRATLAEPVTPTTKKGADKPCLSPVPSAHSSSAKPNARTIRTNYPPRAVSLATTIPYHPQPRPSWRHLRDIVNSLNLPGISYDRHGVFLDPDAPEWVRGRIVRKVQCIVDDLEAGRDVRPLDMDTELELEKEEKAHFDEMTWNYLFKIEYRSDTVEIHNLGLKMKMREFGDKIIAKRARSDAEFIKDGDNEYSTNTDTQQHTPVQLPMQPENVEPEPTAQQPTEQKIDNDIVVQQSPVQEVLYKQATPAQASIQVPYPQQTLAPQMPFNTNHGSSMIGPPGPFAPMQAQSGGAPRRHVSDNSRPAPCVMFAKGYCQYGDKCQFVHAYPHEISSAAAAAAAAVDRRDSTQESIGISRPGSRTSNSSGSWTPFHARPYVSAKWSRPPSRMSTTTNTSTLRSISQGSTENLQSHDGEQTKTRKKKNKNNNWKSAQKANAQDN